MAYLCQEYTGPTSVYYPGEVVRALSSDGHSPVRVVEALRVLAHEPVHVLERRQRLVDQDGDKVEMSPRDLDDARASGSFLHPFTGAQIDDWEARIEEWYEAGSVLDDAFSVDASPEIWPGLT